MPTRRVTRTVRVAGKPIRVTTTVRTQGKKIIVERKFN